MKVRYEWDETKRRANIEKHGIDFTIAKRFDWAKALIVQDQRKDDGEERWIAMAPIENRLHCMVFTRRDHRVRIISLRKANRREVIRYEKRIHEITSS